MWKFANKTFFKFLFGFLLIVLLSFSIIIGATYVDDIAQSEDSAQAK